MLGYIDIVGTILPIPREWRREAELPGKREKEGILVDVSNITSARARRLLVELLNITHAWHS